jgi:hypothetical protein
MGWPWGASLAAVSGTVGSARFANEGEGHRMWWPGTPIHMQDQLAWPATLQWRCEAWGRAHVTRTVRREAQGSSVHFPRCGARPTVGRRVHSARVHSDGREASVRRRVAQVTRGRSRTSARARESAATPAPFYFFEHFSKIQNSKFSKQSWKSPNTKIVEKL